MIFCSTALRTKHALERIDFLYTRYPAILNGQLHIIRSTFFVMIYYSTHTSM